MSAAVVRHQRNHPCEVCGGRDSDHRGDGKRCHGFTSQDGEWGHCSREEFAGSLPLHEGSQTYAHRLHGSCKCGVTHNPGGQQDPTLRVIPTASPSPAPYADPEALNRIYRAVLAACPLEYYHRAFLQGDKCLIPPDALAGYGTLPHWSKQGDLIGHLVNLFGQESLLTVAGFVFMGDRLRLNGFGMLEAVCDVDGRVVGLRVRKDGGGYYWLSSAKAGGRSPGTPIHYVPGADNTITVITEGGRKAHIASIRTGYGAIGLAGHGQYASALEPLQKLQGRGTLAVIIALDEDDSADTAAKVDASRQALIRECLALGLAVQVYRWDSADGKGIDDLLLWEGTPRIEIVRPVLPGDSAADAGAEEAGGPLTIYQQAAWYRLLKSLILARDGLNHKGAMKPAQKLALLATLVLTESYPGRDQPLKQVSMGVVADCVGVGRESTSQAIKSLAAAKLLRREETRVHADGMVKTAIKLGAGRRLGFREVLAEPEHLGPAREKAAARRCAECGGDLKTQHVCTACGTLQGAEPPKPAGLRLKFTRKKPAFDINERLARPAIDAPEIDPESAPPEVTPKVWAHIYRNGTDAQTLGISSGIHPDPLSADAGVFVPRSAFGHITPLLGPDDSGQQAAGP